MADERYEQRQRSPESGQRSRQNSIFDDASGMERDEGRRSFARSEARTGSWFGHEDDDTGDDQGEDGHYRRWRDSQIEQLDRDYDEYRRERQQQFQSDFDTWRQNRRQQAQGQERQQPLSAPKERQAATSIGGSSTSSGKA